MMVRTAASSGAPRATARARPFSWSRRHPRLRLPRGVRPVAAVQGGQGVLDELLPETQDDEEDQQVGQFGPPRASAGIMLRTARGAYNLGQRSGTCREPPTPPRRTLPPPR